MHGEVWPKTLLLVQQIAQTLALHVLHDDCLSAVEFDAVVHGHNVWVRKLCARNCFPAKTFGHLRIVGEVRLQEFYSNFSVKKSVDRHPYFGHPTSVDVMIKPVTTAYKAKGGFIYRHRCHATLVLKPLVFEGYPLLGVKRHSDSSLAGVSTDDCTNVTYNNVAFMHCTQ